MGKISFAIRDADDENASEVSRWSDLPCEHVTVSSPVLAEAYDVQGPKANAAGSCVRSGRRQAVLAEIAGSYLNPALSVETIAAKLGLSRRYVFALLRESGTGFSDRVLELRLQAAFAILRDPDRAALRVSEVAYAAAFNEVSHFNRCFRRRFGTTPTNVRAASGSGLSHQAP